MFSRRLVPRTIALCLGLICFMVNPLFLSGCDQLIPFEFAQQDMEHELARIAPVLTFEDSSYLVEIKLDASPKEVSIVHGESGQMSVFSMAEACGNRAFVASAAACIDTTTLHVQGTLSVTRIADGKREKLIDQVPLLGMYEVAGKRLDNGRIIFGASGVYGSLHYDPGKKAFELGKLESTRNEASFDLEDKTISSVMF